MIRLAFQEALYICICIRGEFSALLNSQSKPQIQSNTRKHDKKGLHGAAQQVIAHHMDISNNLIKEQWGVTSKAFHQLAELLRHRNHTNICNRIHRHSIDTETRAIQRNMNRMNTNHGGSEGVEMAGAVEHGGAGAGLAFHQNLEIPVKHNTMSEKEDLGSGLGGGDAANSSSPLARSYLLAVGGGGGRG